MLNLHYKFSPFSQLIIQQYFYDCNLDAEIDSKFIYFVFHFGAPHERGGMANFVIWLGKLFIIIKMWEVANSIKMITFHRLGKEAERKNLLNVNLVIGKLTVRSSEGMPDRATKLKFI